MLEKTVEAYLVDRVRAAGGDAYKFSSPARVSVPDRIVIFPPARIYFVELKRPGGVVTKGQLREHERLRALGCDVRVIDSREAVDAFVREASAAPAPYLHVYEYPSPFGGMHREFAPLTWNSQRPAQTVPLYAKPQLPDNSRADALTDLQIMEALEAAGVKWQEQRSLANDREILTYGSTPAAEIIAGVRAILAASPVEQHEAAPATWDQLRHSLAVAMCGFAGRAEGHRDLDAAVHALDAITEPGSPLAWLREAAQPAPSAPLEGTGNGADERAAFLTWWCEEVPENMREGWKESVDECLRNGQANDKLYGAWEGFQFGVKFSRAPRTEVAGDAA
ncbi:hypothetical protein LGN20_11430 [Burkholderia cepacia]|uniref:hypothetical protein n=1 Tax=Burkholderia cepacia TaxID=292 RepID=UPI001CF331B9|nr:hypothetical protein [Burkholderia cepacia]MCA8214513.1 hypothetical protein [Burkholderia cepacia]